MARPRLVFMGTPEFSVAPLQSLCAASADLGIDIVAVYTQPPRKAGRGHHIQPSPVHDYAAAQNIPVFHPESLKDSTAQQEFAALNPDIAVVVAYGLILPEAVLNVPKFGCLNIHASLLPRWRGAAPIQRAIEAGDKQTGICIMRMEKGLDTGPVMMRDSVAITPAMNGQILHDALARMGADMITGAVRQILDGTAIFITQDHEKATYAHKLDKSEGQVFWYESPQNLDCKIRAFTPWPGAWLVMEKDGKRLKILQAEIVPLEPAQKTMPDGAILDDELTIRCGQDANAALRLTRVQPESKAAMTGAEFLRGYKATGLSFTPESATLISAAHP